MTKNDLINDIVTMLLPTFTNEQLEIIKSTFIVKMQNYDIHELCTLPSTEVMDNLYIFKRFSVDMLAKGLKQSTIKTYLTYIRQFFAHNNKNYREITSQDLTDYFAFLKVTTNIYGQKNTQNYISNVCRVMFVFFNWAYRKHHIETDIMRDIDRIKPKQKRKEKLTAEEVEACRDNVKDLRESALLELMLSTGMRVGEISKLRIEDIDFEKRKVEIKEGKTDNAERTVFLTIKARNSILRYLDGRTEGYLFIGRGGKDKPLDNGYINKIVRTIGERANCHCKTTVHVFRKTFATSEYQRTKNIKYVSILLGHSSSSVTEKYYLIDDMKEIEQTALAMVG